MEVNEKKQMLQAILQKLFVGLIFCFGIIGFNMTAGKVSAQAAIYKNLSFDLVSERALEIKFPGYDDKNDGSKEIDNWNDYSPSRGYIGYDVTTFDEDGMTKFKYTIHMVNVNVSGHTPWLKVKSPSSGEYIPQGFYRSDEKQGYGLSDDGDPHYTGDTEINESNNIRTYMGLAFNETRIDVKIGYKLTINYNGATTHPDQTTWDAYFHRVHNGLSYGMSEYNETGQIPNVFGSGSVQKTGYTLDGWYCGSQKLFYSDGTPVSGAYVNGSKWSDRSKHPLYMWNGATTITAHWTPKKYRLTLNYNNADKFPNDWGTKQATGVYYQDNFLKYDHYIGNAFGPGKVSRTGYTFNGWWLCNSSGKVAKLWDANGKLIKGRSF